MDYLLTNFTGFLEGERDTAEVWESLAEVWESLSSSTSFAVAVAILAVTCTVIGTVFGYIRRRRISRTKARRHFVKAATFLSAAQSEKTPETAHSLAEQAIEEADRAIQIDPNDAAFHIVKCLALEVLGKSGAAIKELAWALSRQGGLTKPERSSTLIKKAALQIDTGLLQEALLDLHESVALTPTNPRSQVLLGQAYEKDGNIDMAIEAFHQAVLLDPKSPDAKAALQRLQA